MIKIDNIQVFNFEGALRGLRNPLESWDKSDSYFGLCSPTDCHAQDVAAAWVNKMKPDLELESTNFDEQQQLQFDLLKGNILRKFKDSPYAEVAFLGPNDLNLAQRMTIAGPDESKFLRQIFVSMDIEAPLYWWKEMDTYKVGTVANSCSTMHKIATTPITREHCSFDMENRGLSIFRTYDIPNKFRPEGHHLDKLQYSYTFDEMTEAWAEICEGYRRKYLETKDPRYWRVLIQILPASWNQKRTWTANYQVLRAIYFARKNHKLTEWHSFCDMILSLPYGKELITYNKEDK